MSEEQIDLGRCACCNTKEALGICSLCGDVAYCSEECAVADWDEHIDECQLTIVTDPKQTIFVAQEYTGDEDLSPESKDDKFETLPMRAHFKIGDEYGNAMTGEELVEGPADYQRKTILRTGKKRLPAGKREKGSAELYIFVPSTDPAVPFANASINVTLPNRAHWGLFKKGLNVYATSRDLKRAIRGRELYPIPSSGQIAIGVEYNNQKFMVYGPYNVQSGTKKTFGRRLFGFTRRLARMPKKVRIKAVDAQGVAANVGLERPVSAQSKVSTQDVNYVVKYIEMYVPEGIPPDQDGTSQWWNPFDTQDDADRAPVAKFEKERELFDILRRESVLSADAEVKDDMVGLCMAIDEHIDSLLLEKELAQEDRAHDDITDIDSELRLAKDLRNTIFEHAKVLKDEDDEVRDVEDISTSVHVAIANALELVGARSEGRLKGFFKGRFTKKGRLQRMEKKEAQLIAQIRQLGASGQYGSAAKKKRELRRVQKTIVRLGGIPRKGALRQSEDVSMMEN
jgi:hypothetical protein